MEEKKTFKFRCPSKQSILEAFRVTNPKELDYEISSEEEKPKVDWLHIGTIIYGGFTPNEINLKGLCSAEYEGTKFSRFTAKIDTDTKTGSISFAA